MVHRGPWPVACQVPGQLRKIFYKKKIAKPQAASKGGPARNVQGHKEKK